MEKHLEMQVFYCLACSNKQPDFTDEDKKVIRVCRSLITKIYG